MRRFEKSGRAAPDGAIGPCTPDIDPWEEAARLAQLPGEAAARAWAGLISALPKGSATPQDSGTIAARLITPCRASRNADRSAKGPIWRTEHDPDPGPGNDRRADGPVSDYSRSATRQPVGCGEPSGVPSRKEIPWRHLPWWFQHRQRGRTLRHEVLVPASLLQFGNAPQTDLWAALTSCLESAFNWGNLP